MTKALPPSPGAHPIWKFIHQELGVQSMSMAELAQRAGISRDTVTLSIQNKTNVTLRTTEACLNALGFTMKPTVYRGEKR